MCQPLLFLHPTWVWPVNWCLQVSTEETKTPTIAGGERGEGREKRKRRRGEGNETGEGEREVGEGEEEEHIIL